MRPLLFFLILVPALAHSGPDPRVERALGLVEQGAYLDATLLLRELEASEDLALRGLARYHLGQVALARGNAERAVSYLEQAAQDLGAEAPSALWFELAAALARAGQPERVVPLLRSDPVQALPTPQGRLALVRLAFEAGHPEWIDAVSGAPRAEVIEAAVAEASPRELSALAALPGLPPALSTRLAGAAGASEDLGPIVHAALRSEEASPALEVLSGRAPWLLSPASGPIVVPVPLSGPHALFGEATRRVLAYLDARRPEPLPWRFVDVAEDGWPARVAALVRDEGAVAVLGPLGPSSLGRLLDGLGATPATVIPLFSGVEDRALEFPVLPLVFDEADTVDALLAQVGELKEERVAVIASEGLAARGLMEMVRGRIEAAGALVTHDWVLPKGPKEQTTAIAKWVGARKDDPRVTTLSFDVLFLVTNGADGLRVLHLLQYHGVGLPVDGGCDEGTPCLRVLAHRSVDTPSFRDPVRRVSDGVLVAEPCPMGEDARLALEEALGRPAFPIERQILQLAELLVAARERALGGSALDIARQWMARRLWAGSCGAIEVEGGRGRWPIRVAPLVTVNPGASRPEDRPGSDTSAPGEAAAPDAGSARP
jgi:hypothetical protein